MDEPGTAAFRQRAEACAAMPSLDAYQALVADLIAALAARAEVAEPLDAMLEVERALRNAYGDVNDVWPSWQQVRRAAARAEVAEPGDDTRAQWIDWLASRRRSKVNRSDTYTEGWNMAHENLMASIAADVPTTLPVPAATAGREPLDVARLAQAMTEAAPASRPGIWAEAEAIAREYNRAALDTPDPGAS